MKTMLKIFGWVIFPYIMLGMLVSKKTGNKLIGLSTGLIMFFVLYAVGCSDNNSTIVTESESIKNETAVVSTVKPTVKSESTIKPTTKPSPKVSVKPAVKKEKVVVKKDEVKSGRLSIELSLIVLKNTYKDIAKVETEGRNIKIICYDTTLAYEVLQAKEGDKTKIKQWKDIESSLKKCSINMERDITISIMNPLNTENTFLTIMDGVTIYNYID